MIVEERKRGTKKRIIRKRSKTETELRVLFRTTTTTTTINDLLDIPLLLPPHKCTACKPQHHHQQHRHHHHQQQHSQQWIANASAAAIATVVSGPLNFARNVQYATKSRQERKSIGIILSKLVHHTLEQPTWMDKWTYVQNRLRIGWGTARVAVGVAFGHHVYDVCMTTFHTTTTTTTASSY
mmetsp:Transcript_27728/g.42438  ORF Transcript_27728/g.42438 Transcript_27728/m.42438 type:complete len:182 (+) Transcript_27728:122-667(+)